MIIAWWCATTSLPFINNFINLSLLISVHSVNPSTIKKGEIVGHGQFGVVYKGEWRGTEIAIKTITLPPEKQNGSCEDIKELQICRYDFLYFERVFSP